MRNPALSTPSSSLIPFRFQNVVEALEPFAHNQVGSVGSGADGHIVGIYVRLGDLRKARKALEGLLDVLRETE